jgi:hypothetical protein
VTTLAYLPGIGFRPSGLRLAGAASEERDGLTLTVHDIVATPLGTDIRYEITGGSDGAACIVPGQDKNAFDAGSLAFVIDGQEFAGGMCRSASVIRGGMRYVFDGPRLPQDADHAELRIRNGYYGDWNVSLDFVLFRADLSPMRELDESATHEGITVHLRGIGRGPDETAIRFNIVVPRPAFPNGAGGLQSMRHGPTALRLRDDKGREYEELPPEQMPGRTMGEELGVFGAIADDAKSLELEVPFVYVSEQLTKVEVALPVTAPVEATLGPYPIRVLPTGEAPDSLRRRNFGPALSIPLDLGGWQGDRRIIYPMRVQIDGQDRGVGYGNGINAADPTPVETIEIRPEPTDPKTMTLSGGTIQIRGPWRVRFAVD